MTVEPGHLAHRIQACISVRFANTFVVVGLCQQVCLFHLSQTRSYVAAGMSVSLVSDPQLCLLCLYPTNGLLSTIAPDHQACMAVMSLNVAYNQHACRLQIHLISIHECYICTQPSAMSVTIASDHLSCL